ncbi:hypothetical protein BC834DRAFT_1019810 [Gloeopeniophorella convolvens]|nr:hypothetical protein BC834DRAFT_1019810 [Gloeopeniophorella convolvens]
MQQWSRDYYWMVHDCTSDPSRQARIRAYIFEGIAKFHVRSTLGLLPFISPRPVPIFCRSGPVSLYHRQRRCMVHPWPLHCTRRPIWAVHGPSFRLLQLPLFDASLAVPLAPHKRRLPSRSSSGEVLCGGKEALCRTHMAPPPLAEEVPQRPDPIPCVLLPEEHEPRHRKRRFRTPPCDARRPAHTSPAEYSETRRD